MIVRPGWRADKPVNHQRAGVPALLSRVVAVPFLVRAPVRSVSGVGIRVVACVALFAVLLGACAGDDAPSAARARVVAKEMRFTPSRLTVKAGPVVFHVVNQGTITHTFSVGPDADEVTVNPGHSADLNITLVPGTYTYICRILDHAGLGMHGVLKVRP